MRLTLHISRQNSNINLTVNALRANCFVLSMYVDIFDISFLIYFYTMFLLLIIIETINEDCVLSGTLLLLLSYCIMISGSEMGEWKVESRSEISNCLHSKRGVVSFLSVHKSYKAMCDPY
jgi:hypothetical protein